MSVERQTGEVQLLAVDAVWPALDSRPGGLASAEAGQRQQANGPNAIRKVSGKPLAIRMVHQFTHLMAVLLWLGGLMALIAQMPQMAVAIWMVNVINGAFSFWQEFKAEKAAEALQKMLPAYVRVLRDGQEQRALAEMLVPGDVMLLVEGDRISADARLVQAAELRVDQSTFTGESQPVRKSSDPMSERAPALVECSNLIFAGTSVVAGTGKAVVYATGMSTEFGKIAHLTQSVAEELSPLQREMSAVTRQVTLIAAVVGLIFFAIALAVARITLSESFVFAVGMIVAFVPEGLLPTVTLALAMGTQRMAKRNALIKRLSAVETLGCATVICTDKTGTLTENEMTVRNIWLPDRRLTVTGGGYEPVGQLLRDDKPITLDDADAGGLRQLLRAACLCNDARVLPPGPESARWTVLGDPTEAALLVAAMKARVDPNTERQLTPRTHELPFESRRKRMSTIHQSGDRPIAYVKGAPREILALCNRIAVNETVSGMTDEQRQQIVAANDGYAREGLRVLAIARRELGPEVSRRSGLSQITSERIECDLVFLGLIAMMDPPRREVAAAVEKCHHAGIRIVMITGDYGLTAESIARRIGIVRGAARVITGSDLNAMDDGALRETLRGEVIFARAAPEDKLRVVGALQADGHVVAVTGDGVNDAPALKKADIGVAMGIAGTDVAKEAADMILTDDNFASIVNAIEEGRAVYSNIKKFTTYIFTSNTPEAIPFIIFVLSRTLVPLAINVMHVLSIDLGTDMMPALALGSEPPEPGLMDRPPRALSEHVITRGLLARAYLWLGLVQGLAAMSAFYFQFWTNGYWGQWLGLPNSGTLYQSATAMALAAVVMAQIGNLFSQRSERLSVFKLGWRGLRENRMIWIGIAVELILVLGIVYAPPLQRMVGTAAFSGWNWLFLVIWAPAVLLVDECRKWLARRKGDPS